MHVKIKRIVPFVLGGCFLIFSHLSAREQLFRTDADSLIRRGDELLNWGRPEQALEVFKDVLEAFPKDVEARFGRAEAHMALHEWGDASSWYDAVLDEDPDRVAAHYGKAVAKRETGKHTVLLQRYLIWRSARKHFEKAAALDSAFRDLLFQWALLERYDRNFKKAILLAHRQTRTLVNEKIQLGLLMMYDFFVEHTDEKEAESWLRSRSTPYDKWALGELYRRSERFQEADSVFRALLAWPRRIPVQAVHLSMVRLAVQTGRPDLAESHYWQAVDKVRNMTGVELILQDFMTVIHEEEYSALRDQVTLSNFSSTMHRFWQARDPLPASPTNLRLIEHYRRTLHAEQNYRYDGFRHRIFTTDKYVNFDLPVWTAENYKYSDPGLVYIRYGEPDEKSFAISEDGIQNMSWLYHARGGQAKMIFHFAVKKDAPPGLWTLVSGFSDPRILEGMLSWDRIYQELMFATGNEYMARWHELTTERAEMVRVGMRSDRHTWMQETELLEMYQTLSRFRKSDSGDVLQIAYAVPVSTYLDSVPGPDTLRLESGVAVFDRAMTPVYKSVETDTITNLSDARVRHGFVIHEHEVPVGLETYNVALHARIPDRDRVNAWKYRISLSDEDRETFSISSLKLAYDIAPRSDPSARHRRGLNMVPNPSGRFKPQDAIFAYYELYNLAYGRDGKTRYAVDFTLRRDARNKGLFDKLFGWIGGGGGTEISLRSEQTGASRTASDYLSFDVSGSAPGKYELKLVVKDLVLGEKAEAAAYFELVE